MISAFAERLRAVDGAVDFVADVAAARDHIARLCSTGGDGDLVSTRAAADTYAPPHVVTDGDVARIAGAAAGISVAVLGIAETGSVLLAMRSRHDRLVALLPPLQIVVLDAASVHATLDTAAAAMRQSLADGLPYLTLVTGPSRTADIERVITVGAHGPRRLHVVVVGDGTKHG